MERHVAFVCHKIGTSPREHDIVPLDASKCHNFSSLCQIINVSPKTFIFLSITIQQCPIFTPSCTTNTVYFIYVFKKAKILYYDNQILYATNKIKTTWKIVNLETRRKGSNAAVDSLNIDDRIINNQQLIANTCNNYFISKTDNIDTNNNNNNNNNNTKQI
jgi:hypothetical protein